MLETEESPAPRPPTGLRLAAFLLAELLVLAMIQVPLQRFDAFALRDSGGELAIQDLLRRGSRPTVDFGYPYGLLPLLIGRAWYGTFGLLPVVYRGEVLIGLAVLTVGLARLAAVRRVGPAGVALIALAMPDVLLPSYITGVQVLEAALLVLALAELARGRRRSALALATACVFVKPSIAFVLGLVLLIAIVLAHRREGLAGLARALAPAAITGLGLSAGLGAIFGPRPLVRTLLPLTGMAIYRHDRTGFFFGVGRDFWLLPDAGLIDYFRYEVGFWLVGTLVLTLGAVSGLIGLAGGRSAGDRARGDEIVATCAAVHLGFVTFLFGHRVTWFYSFPILILGLATMAARGRRQAVAVGVLACMLLVNDRSKLLEVRNRWAQDATSPETFGLWAGPAERSEWSRVLELTRGGDPAWLAPCDGAALLAPRFAPPTVGYLLPGNPTPSEVRRKAEQLAEAPMIVSVYGPDWEGFALWPELAGAIEGCDPIWKGDRFRVYRRRGTVSPGAGSPRPGSP